MKPADKILNLSKNESHIFSWMSFQKHNHMQYTNSIFRLLPSLQLYHLRKIQSKKSWFPSCNKWHDKNSSSLEQKSTMKDENTREFTLAHCPSEFEHKVIIALYNWNINLGMNNFEVYEWDTNAKGSIPAIFQAKIFQRKKEKLKTNKDTSENFCSNLMQTLHSYRMYEPTGSLINFNTGLSALEPQRHPTGRVRNL